MNEEMKKGAALLSDEDTAKVTGGTGGCVFYVCPDCGTENEMPNTCSCGYKPSLTPEILTVDTGLLN